ncbi:hypothetical protein O6H91_Y405900 [Diphasiastrum complanatum]|nr:hypothetical protein O6H91_Y405900 [Diphasiastrum complanatum]
MPSRSSSLATAAAVAADGSTHGALDAQGKRKQEPLDLQSLRHDVASFAASLGLQPNDQSSLGFNDIDFRRTGPIASESSKIKAGQQKNVAKINLEHQEGHEQTQRREHEHKKKHEHEKQSKIDDNGSKNAKRQKLNKPSSTENDRRKEDRSSDLNPPAKASGLVPNRKEKEAVVHQEGSVGRNVGDSSSRFLSQVCKQVLNSGASEACGSWYEASEKLAARLAPHIVHMTSPGGKNESKHLTRGDGFSQLNQHNRLPFAPTEVFEKKRQEGQHLLNRLMQDYQNHHNKDSANRFLLTARRAGTSADKVAAMTVMIQGNPLANLSTLDTLLGFVTSKGGKRKASLGIDVLKELFLTKSKTQVFEATTFDGLNRVRRGGYTLTLLVLGRLSERKVQLGYQAPQCKLSQLVNCFPMTFVVILFITRNICLLVVARIVLFYKTLGMFCRYFYDLNNML